MHFTPTARLRLTHRLPQLEGFASPAPIIYNHSNKKTAPSWVRRRAFGLSWYLKLKTH